MDATAVVTRLGLAPHPEGGHFRETFRDPAGSAIYFLLAAGEVSAWHRIDAAETWHVYAGAPLDLSVSTDGRLRQPVILGPDLAAGQEPQVTVPAGAWQSARTLGPWTLAGCTVAPAFRFEGFELAETGWQPPRLGPIVGSAWVAAHRQEVVLCDVRWYLDGRSGRDAYRRGHIAGAVFVDLDAVLAGRPSPASGRHPLPEPDTLAAGMAAAGVRDDSVVVAYDDQAGAVAGRLVWMLRVLGHDAALLDGGLAPWTAPLASGEPSPAVEPGSFTARPWPRSSLADADELGRPGTDGPVVVDARAAARYRGEVEPVDPRAGHVPGAINLPATDNLGPDGRFRPPAELRQRFEAAGVGERDTVVYCGSGVTACHDLLAIEQAGLGRARLYAGSWSQWSSAPDRPVATGDRP